MKKRIYPCNATMVFVRIAYICILILCLYVLYIDFTDPQFRYSIPFMLIFSPYVLYYIVILYFEKIIICKKKIIIRGDKEQRKNGYDYEIAFDDIKELRLILTRKIAANSEEVHTRIQQYLEIELINEKTKWVSLSNYSSKQQNKIIEIINSKAQLNKSYEDMKNELIQSQFEGRKTFFR